MAAAKSLPGTNPIWNGTDYFDYVASGGADRTQVAKADGRGRLTRMFYDFAGRMQAIMNPGATTEPTAANPHQAFAKFSTYRLALAGR